MARMTKGSRAKRDCILMTNLRSLVDVDGAGNVACEEKGCNQQDEERLIEHGGVPEGLVVLRGTQDGAGKNGGRDEKNKGGLNKHDEPPERVVGCCCIALHITHGLVEAARKQESDGKDDDCGLHNHNDVPLMVLIVLLHFFHGMKETASQEHGNIKNEEGGLCKHVCSPYRVVVKVFTFPSWHNSREPNRREGRRP